VSAGTDDLMHPGAALVLIHGWGLHGGIWADLLPSLAPFGEPLAPDLPGHGASPWPPGGFGLESAADDLAAAIPAGATVLGWSLGAMVALTLARRHPTRVGRLVLVAATPRFTRAADWSCAVDPTVVDGFARDLAKDYRETLRRFLALQVRGGTTPRETLRRLRELLFARGEPSPRALADGLGVLRNADLRETLSQITQPALVIAGERDRLVPAAASRSLSRALPRGRYVGLPGAAHAPFLSHRDAFVAALGEETKVASPAEARP
jgi:pimeloyl-[acyl-carrier protein] methyl ester esterase